ncbi:hypothetical protein E1H18_3406 [Caulobacter sp. RHG1]|nr:hypothetical protein [Caulobacter sp. RHG1]
MLGFFGLSALSLAAFVVSLVAPSIVIDLFCCALFALLVGWVYQTSKLSFVLLLPILMYRISSFASLVIISSGAKIPEIGRVGEESSACPSYLLMTIMFFGLIVTFIEFLGQKFFKRSYDNFYSKLDLKLSLSPIAIGVVLALIAIQVLILFAYGALNGFPLITRTDRFLYRMMSGNALYVFVLNFKLITALMFGMAVISVRAKEARFLLIASYVVLVFFYILFGEKFNQLLLITFTSAIPVLLFNAKSLGKLIARFAPIALSVSVLSLFLVFFIYSDYGRMNLAATSERVFGRMAQQSQLWYIVNLQDIKLFKFDDRYFSDLLHTMTSFGADQIFFQRQMGAFYFIYKYSPSNISNSIALMQGAVQFTQVSEALFLDIFGVSGLVFYLILSSFLYSGFVLFLVSAIFSGSLLRVALWAVYMSGVLAMLNQGAIHQAVGLGLPRYAILALLIEFGMRWLAGQSARYRTAA